jgi:outer membrane protein OmpA-like peptidoglycan-associated protein
LPKARRDERGLIEPASPHDCFPLAHRGSISRSSKTTALQGHSIHFDYKIALPAQGQDDILDDIAAELRELAKLSSPQVHAKVTLTGHADAVGEGTFNLALSVARAEAVRALLKKRGVDPDLLAVRGAGPLEPAEAGDTKAAQAANRRVSLSVGVEEQAQ